MVGNNGTSTPITKSTLLKKKNNLNPHYLQWTDARYYKIRWVVDECITIPGLHRAQKAKAKRKAASRLFFFNHLKNKGILVLIIKTKQSIKKKKESCVNDVEISEVETPESKEFISVHSGTLSL